MVRRAITILAGAAAIAVLGAVPATAGVVYSQPGDGAACTPDCWTSSYGTDGYGANFQGFDNFTLSKTASITTVQWQGFYIDYVDLANNPVTPVTNDWDIGFYADSSGLPGSALSTATLPAADVTATYLDQDTFAGATVNVYSFTATLPTAFVASAGSTYWFSPLSVQTSGNPLFSWSGAVTEVDDVSAQETPAGGSPYATSDDRAFTLLSAVPEPSTWSLTILSAFGLGAALRRRRLAL